MKSGFFAGFTIAFDLSDVDHDGDRDRVALLERNLQRCQQQKSRAFALGYREACDQHGLSYPIPEETPPL